MRTRLALDPLHSALLLIDLQEEQRQHALYSVAGFDRVIGNARILLQAARARGTTVVHTAYRRDFALCPPRPFEPLAGDERDVWTPERPVPILFNYADAAELYRAL